VSRYLLDTSVLIDLSKGREPTRTHLRAMLDSGDELGICAINVAEFYLGVPPSAWPQWDAFFGSLQYWDITRPAAVDAARLRQAATRRGQPLSLADTLIAAVARERLAVILTENLKDYPGPDVQARSLR
jgi:predicted nucleic acid-binding protein